MSAESNSDIQIFTEALRLSPEARPDYVDRTCAGDENLRRKVQALLRANDRAGRFLEELTSAFAGERVQQAGAIEKPGDRIGRYQLLKQIVVGGWGVVFLAEQKEPVHRKVALKVIKPGMDTKSVIARFEAERQAMALMDHPQIAHVLDAGATQTGRPFFVMELVRGIKITDYCDQNSLTTHERLELFIKVCGAIQYAHQKGIIHRDIKPSNILVDTGPDGEPSPKVIDFGIVKATTNQRLTDNTILTANEVLLGTPAYMSPEQADQMDIDTRADIYSLGVLLYELLTGTTPFDSRILLSKRIDEIRRIISGEDPARPSARLKAMSLADLRNLPQRQRADCAKLMREVRGDLDWIVMKALEKDRARRYATGNGLAMDVQRYLAGEPISARPPTVFYKLQKTVARNKTLFAGIGVIVALLVFFLSTERRAHRKAETEAAKSRQVTRFLEDMLQSVGPSAEVGKDTTMLREILDKTSAQIGTGMTNQPEVEAEVRNLMGRIYRQIGVYDQAENMDRAALALDQKLAGADSREAAAALDELGLALISQAKLADAERVEQQSLDIRRRLFGNENADVAASLQDLAHAKMDSGEWSEAEALTRESLAIREKLFGGQSLEVADSLRGLGILQGDEGKWVDAEATEWQVLAIRKKCLGSEHPWVASSLADVAWAAGGSGKLDEAASLEREALVMREKLLSPDHPDIARSLYLLGERERQRGNFPEAGSLLTDARAMQLKSVLAGTPGYIETLRSLGLALEAQGKAVETEQVRREILATWRKLGLGDTPRAVTDLGDLVHVLMIEGKLIEAEQLLDQAIVPSVTKMPSMANLFILGASLKTRLAHWQQAASDAALAWQYRPNDNNLYPMVAALLVKTGNSAGYQHFCQTILATSSNTLNYFIADAVAKSCVFGPSAGVNLEEVSRLEDWALAHAAGDNGAMPYLQDCKALCEYRLGHFAGAVEWAEKPTKSLTVLVQPHSYATLAMAKWRLGRKTEAAAMLAKGKAMAPDIMPESIVRENGTDWLAWLYARVQLDEAAALIETESTAGSNVAKP